VTAVASPASIGQSATTQLTVTVKPAAGTAAPAGTVTIALGNSVLGTAPLTASAGVGTATFSVKGGSLAPGANSIVVGYGGGTSFAPAAGSVTVTLTGVAVVAKR
jgi:hypothetical protein